MSTKQVFLSHSSHDAVLTRLLGHILEEEGLKCFYSERDIPVGQEFDEKIVARIHACNVLLVVWTARASASPWVNQEIGIAIGKNIPVWPLAIDTTTIQGAMFRCQGSLLVQDPDPHAAIVRLAREIKNISEDGNGPFAPHVDHFLVGKEERTRKLVELLRAENSRRAVPYTLRLQAAFSCFAISPDPGYRVAGYHTMDYQKLRSEERYVECDPAKLALLFISPVVNIARLSKGPYFVFTVTEEKYISYSCLPSPFCFFTEHLTFFSVLVHLSLYTKVLTFAY